MDKPQKHLIKFERTNDFYNMFHRLTSMTRVKWQVSMLDPHQAIPFKPVPDSVEYVGLDPSGHLCFVASNIGDGSIVCDDMQQFEDFALKYWEKR